MRTQFLKNWENNHFSCAVCPVSDIWRDLYVTIHHRPCHWLWILGSPGVECGGWHVRQWARECLFQQLSRPLWMDKLRLTSWACCPLWSDGTHSSEIVRHKKLGQTDTCFFSSYPAECSENYIVSTDTCSSLACFSLPFQCPLMERGRVWWPATSPCQIEEFCGPLLSGEEMPLQVWSKLLLS